MDKELKKLLKRLKKGYVVVPAGEHQIKNSSGNTVYTAPTTPVRPALASKVGKRSTETRADRMNNYTVEINTIQDIADAAFLDRLADCVYELPGLVDPTLALNDDGSVTATFEVVGADPLVAAQQAVEQLVEALAAAEPLEKAEASSARAVEGFTVTHSRDREAVTA